MQNGALQFYPVVLSQKDCCLTFEFSSSQVHGHLGLLEKYSLNLSTEQLTQSINRIIKVIPNASKCSDLPFHEIKDHLRQKLYIALIDKGDCPNTRAHTHTHTNTHRYIYTIYYIYIHIYNIYNIYTYTYNLICLICNETFKIQFCFDS